MKDVFLASLSRHAYVIILDIILRADMQDTAGEAGTSS